MRSRSVSFAADEIIGTQPHSSLHGDELTAPEIKPPRFDKAGFVIALKHKGRVPEIRNRTVHRQAPIGMGKVTAEENTSRTPGMRRKPRYF